MLKDFADTARLMVVGALLFGVATVWMIITGILTLMGVLDWTIIWIVGPELVSFILLMLLILTEVEN